LEPVAERTGTPSTSNSSASLPGSLPPPMRNATNARSIVNGGDSSVPVLASPPAKELTSPRPRKPSTAIWPGSAPRAGAVPKAVPSTFQSP